VMSDVPAGEKWFGYPAMRGREFLRSMMTLRHWVSKTDAADNGDDESPDDGASQGSDGRRKRKR